MNNSNSTTVIKDLLKIKDLTAESIRDLVYDSLIRGTGLKLPPSSNFVRLDLTDNYLYALTLDNIRIGLKVSKKTKKCHYLGLNHRKSDNSFSITILDNKISAKQMLDLNQFIHENKDMFQSYL